MVDRLLASPQYGETWGRLWLDVARYGEDDYRSLDPKQRGYNPYPNAYLYRDWVIKAFNDDLPYDQFVRAQLAGDLIGEPATRARTLPALGFLGLGPWFYDNGAVEITRADERHDRVDVVSRGFLGLTVGCARCHDHKYDPIPTRDYYSLAGVFLNTSYREYPLVPKSVVDEYDAQDKQIEKKEKLLDEFMRDRVDGSSARRWRCRRRSTWWRRGRCWASRRKRSPKVVDAEKLDYELFDRWLKFLAKPPRFYPYLTSWQEMIKGGGSAAEAKKLADEFQALLLDVMFERKEIKEENDIIDAKALPGTKKKEPAKLPSDFVTNDDFCPGLRARAEEPAGRAQQPVDRRVPARPAGRLRSRAGVGADQARAARVPRLGAGAAAERATGGATSTACAPTSRRCARRSRRSTRSCTASPTSRSRST